MILFYIEMCEIKDKRSCTLVFRDPKIKSPNTRGSIAKGDNRCLGLGTKGNAIDVESVVDDCLPT